MDHKHVNDKAGQVGIGNAKRRHHPQEATSKPFCLQNLLFIMQCAIPLPSAVIYHPVTSLPILNA